MVSILLSEIFAVWETYFCCLVPDDFSEVAILGEPLYACPFKPMILKGISFCDFSKKGGVIRET